MQLDGIRQKVFLDRYSLKDEVGEPTEQTPEEMWKRVARGIAKQETKENRRSWRHAGIRSECRSDARGSGRILGTPRHRSARGLRRIRAKSRDGGEAGWT